MLLERSADQWLADKKTMTDYICERIPDDGIEIVLAEGEGGPLLADLFPTWDDRYGWELVIETNEPEWASIKEIYNYVRCANMSSLEKQQERPCEIGRYTSLESATTEPPSEVKPYWDSDLMALWFGDKLIKAFREEAENQKLVLGAFQKQEWRHRIDDPIVRHAGEPTLRRKRRLRDTITGLNADHITPGVIRFRGDGTGKGVIWMCCK